MMTDPPGENDSPELRRPRFPLAWRNLTENRLRLLASLAGDGVRRDADVHGARVPAVAAGEHGRR